MEKRQKFTLNLGFLRYREQLVHKMFVLDHFQIYRVTQKKRSSPKLEYNF